MLDSLSGILASVWREAVIMFIFYFLQFLMIMADLWAGVRKSKRAGRYIASSGLRRTVDKICKYYNMAMLFTLVDVVLIVAIQHYDEVAGVSWPSFPLFTMLATLIVALIEGKSIFEKFDRKTKAAAEDAAAMVAYLLKHVDDADKLMAIAERIQSLRQNPQDNEHYTEDYGDTTQAREPRR